MRTNHFQNPEKYVKPVFILQKILQLRLTLKITLAPLIISLASTTARAFHYNGGVMEKMIVPTVLRPHRESAPTKLTAVSIRF